MKFVVQISRTIREYAIVSVEAENVKAARRKGIKEAKREQEEQQDTGGIFCDADAPKYRVRNVKPSYDYETPINNQ